MLSADSLSSTQIDLHTLPTPGGLSYVSPRTLVPFSSSNLALVIYLITDVSLAMSQSSLYPRLFPFIKGRQPILSSKVLSVEDFAFRSVSEAIAG